MFTQKGVSELTFTDLESVAELRVGERHGGYSRSGGRMGLSEEGEVF